MSEDRPESRRTGYTVHGPAGIVATGWIDEPAHPREDAWNEAHLHDLDELNRRAHEIAPELVGLTVEQAQALIDRHPDISVQFRDPNRFYPLRGVFGRVNAYVEDGIVTSTG